MKLVKRNRNYGWPSLFDDFFTNEFGNLPSNFSRTHVPAVNIKETEEAFELEVAVPGINKDEVKIEVKHDLLSISFEQKHENEEKDEKGNYTRKEFGYRSFNRSFRLPDTVEGKNIHAKYEDGILWVTLPKTEKAKETNRLIEIA